MNPKSIEQAHDADLRLSHIALLRAAQRAREVALRTGTMLVVSGPRGVEKLSPVADANNIQEAPAPYGSTK